jgi:hypothetical protein
MYSRTQWYLLTSVRLGGVFLLVLTIGRRVEQMKLPPWAMISIGGIVFVIGSALVNTWAISYGTYLKEHDEEK